MLATRTPIDAITRHDHGFTTPVALPVEHLTAKTRDGAALAYRHEAGAGIAVLNPLSYAATLRGLDGAHGQHDFLLALGAGHQLIYYDQRGSGDSCAGVPTGWEQR